MPKIRILATEDGALHEEMLRITIDKLGYGLIDVIYKLVCSFGFNMALIYPVFFR